MLPEVSRSASVGTLASSSNPRHHQNSIYFDPSKLAQRPLLGRRSFFLLLLKSDACVEITGLHYEKHPLWYPFVTAYPHPVNLHRNLQFGIVMAWLAGSNA
jgi:hypothetical protein